MQFKCSHCGQRLEIGDEQAGREASCPFCSQLTLVPEPRLRSSRKKAVFIVGFTIVGIAIALAVFIALIRVQRNDRSGNQLPTGNDPSQKRRPVLVAPVEPQRTSNLKLPPLRTERLIGRPGQLEHAFGYTMADDCRHVAWLESQSEVRAIRVHTPAGTLSGWQASNSGDIQVVVDGETKGNGVSVSTPVFSPDGKRCAFSVGDKDELRVLCDEQTGPLFNTVGGITFSPDGRFLAYVAQDKDNTCRVVVNGRKLPDFQAIYYESIQFSPNGRRLTYLAKKSGREVFVIHFRKDPQTTADSKHLLYRGETDEFADRPMVTILPQDSVSFVSRKLTFSPDGMRFAYFVRSGKGMHCLENIEKGPFVTYEISGAKGDEIKWNEPTDDAPGFETIDASSLVFSSDSLHIAFAAVVKGRWFIVDQKYMTTGDHPLGPFYWNTNLIGVTKLELGGNGYGVLVDGSANKFFKQVLRLYPDNHSDQIAAVILNDDDTQGVWVRGRDPFGHYHGIVEDSVCFSRDGRHIAFAAKKGDRYVVVLDGKELTEHAVIGSGTVHFLGNTDLVVWMGSDGTSEYLGFKNEGGKKFTRIVGGKMRGAEEGHVRYFAVQDRTMYFVEERFFE